MPARYTQNGVNLLCHGETSLLRLPPCGATLTNRIKTIFFFLNGGSVSYCRVRCNVRDYIKGEGLLLVYYIAQQCGRHIVAAL